LVVALLARDLANIGILPIEVNPKIQNQKAKMKKVILAKFQGTSKEYAFFCDTPGVEVNDMVVVACTGQSSSYGYAIVEVTAVIGLTPAQIANAAKWVVQKLDLAEFEKKQKIETLKQEIINKAVERSKQVNQLDLLKQYAQSDPEIKGLLEQYADLDPSFTLVIEKTEQ